MAIKLHQMTTKRQKQCQRCNTIERDGSESKTCQRRCKISTKGYEITSQKLKMTKKMQNKLQLDTTRPQGEATISTNGHKMNAVTWL